MKAQGPLAIARGPWKASGSGQDGRQEMLKKKFLFSRYIQKVMSGSYQGDVLTRIDWALNFKKVH